MIGDERRSHVMTFIGTTPNIGTTLIALTTAIRLAEQTGKRVAYLCLNLKSSKLHRYIGVGEKRASLDELLPHLRNSSLDEQMLHHALHRYSSSLELYLLFGNRYRETAEYYGVEEMLHLIQTARQAYDYVLLDASAYWDNAGTISALLEADSVIVATTSALSHFQEDYLSWAGVMGEHIQLNSKALYCTVIKQQTGLYQPRHCYLQLAGQALPLVSIPPSLYEALDRGELKMWYQQRKEGAKWLADYVKQLVPQRKSNDPTKRRQSWNRTVSAATTMLFKQN